MSTEEEEKVLNKEIIINESELSKLYKQSIESSEIDENEKERMVKRFMELVNYNIH